METILRLFTASFKDQKLKSATAIKKVAPVSTGIQFFVC